MADQTQTTEPWLDINDEYQDSGDVRGYFPIRVRLSSGPETTLFHRPEDIPSGTIFTVVEVNCNE